MRRFPVDVPKTRAIRTLERLGFRVVREGSHISMVRIFWKLTYKCDFL